MYKIASQLAKALNNFDKPYGGINMIFAGDFAQWPPVGGQSLYSHSVGTQVHSGLKPGGQEAAVFLLVFFNCLQVAGLIFLWAFLLVFFNCLQVAGLIFLWAFLLVFFHCLQVAGLIFIWAFLLVFF
ncbi:uncharacterized protein LACBIDRAFT_297853 [Laccaria bicolor S238N-H82]|uniref:Predicted protein n=1 Tax=Laccaria bicolor (strain S238N-H82 / ATCC MYA-4686) TaxID=486041 RepID=B0DB16_LACBS|nr:uncharacterized protein LACBIDRAFT_297853 [Laccaria bicolor S238N-H82]EDR08306.1 predicted protein [Laccaria bicolor S238N-H82]|eukprot:XP_001881376.1 predicted protein [Laccaria bicolor S238N-H82]